MEMIDYEEMYYKIYYPTEFWYVKMKYSGDEAKMAKFKENAVRDDAVLFLPHVNYSADYTLRKVEGEVVIQEGLSSIKGIGYPFECRAEGQCLDYANVGNTGRDWSGLCIGC